jgi:ABC-type nitrate/sulfonate/bicarbonate transport system permease component
VSSTTILGRPARVTTHNLKVMGVRFLAVAVFFGTWWYLLGPGDASPLIVPEMREVWNEFVAFLLSADTYRHVRATMTAILTSILIAGTAGFFVGFWGARTNLRTGILEPLLVWGYLVPSILFYPVLLLWFGFGISSKIAYGTISAFFPIAFNCLRGFARVDARYISVGRAFGASPHQLDWVIKLRAALPMAAAGLKIGSALAMITVIVAEMLSSAAGLGYLIRFFSGSFNTARMYAAILLVLMVVWVFHFVVGMLLRENRFQA